MGNGVLPIPVINLARNPVLGETSQSELSNGNFNRRPKIELSNFDGNHPKTWIRKC
ncbi:conserved hypothetical protein [Ricinus communis]|uniref:Uncharacterized protein n=1 Tax=Ricinus communis TaxID=3988 RepID=B9SUS0_RICCO|nr:conserved hypothetical protein [Ricinus communis]